MDIGEWIQFDKTIKKNDIEEYRSGENRSLAMSDRRLSHFFNPTEARDYTDRVWDKNMKITPFCFNSNNWSLYLNSVANSLMREALGDAGVGSANHQVIMDYVRYITEKRKPPKFEIDANIRYFNNQCTENVKTVDYFNEIFVLTKNMVVLCNPKSGPTSIKVVINYLMTVINARNVDKIRAILDSRILHKCLNFL